MKVQKKKYIIWLIFICALICGWICGCTRMYTESETMSPEPEITAGEVETTPEPETATSEPETTVVEIETTTVQEENTMMTEEVNTMGYYGALHVENGKLCDAANNPVALKGISTAGLQWFPQYVNEETFAFLKEATGMNVIRLAMYTAEGGYCHKDANGKLEMEALIDKGVKAATELDLYVVIDWHILSDNNPNNYKEESKAFFDKMSKQYAGYDNVIYEICNEPNGNTSWEDIKQYANEVIPVIRNNDTDAIVLVGTPTWSQDIDKAMRSPLEYENIMYTYHFYAADHVSTMQVMDAYSNGFPVFISEFGFMESSGDGDINESSGDNWRKVLDERNISYVAWNISNSKGSASIFKDGSSDMTDMSDDNLKTWGVYLKNWDRSKSGLDKLAIE